jgi:serine/threonine protein kinase
MVAAGVSHVHSIDHPDFPRPVENGYDDDSDDGGGRRGKRYHPPREIGRGSTAKVASNATLVHYNLNPRNIAVVRRGKPKLNDFNVAEFMTCDTENNRTCGFPGRFRGPWWRSREEMHFHTPIDNRTPAPLTEKVDIYSLGSVLMEILTTHSTWGTMQKG